MIPAIQYVFPGMMAWLSDWQEAASPLIFLSSILAVGLVAFAWAVFIRKRKKRRKHHHRPNTWEQEPVRHQSKHQHKQSGHTARRAARPMNPTLADVRGLPPVRPDETTNSSQPNPLQ
jgi:hypothetical protein